jgi:hypothetical protein
MEIAYIFILMMATQLYTLVKTHNIEVQFPAVLKTSQYKCNYTSQI